MDPITVFVSSTYRDKEWRETAIQAIRGLPDFSPVLVEESQATMRAPEQLVAEEIAKSNVFVLIVGASHGTFAPGKQSFTELEYEIAVRTGKPILTFVSEDAVSDRADSYVAKFVSRLAKNHGGMVFSSPQELSTIISESLLRLKQERFGDTFSISFDPALTDKEVQVAFQALADYFRACGGVGLEVKFEWKEAEVRELFHV